MTPKTPANPLYITTNEELSHLCILLQEENIICMDTEFMRIDTYFPRLCLIQIATSSDIALVDPLAEGIDLEPLWQILEDPTKCKVLHSCRQDLEIFYYTRGKLPENIFDTQVAAMLCGLGDTMSLESLVALACNVNMDKTQRRSDWLKRPLNNAQLDYAAMDVRYLHRIHKKLNEHLVQQKRMEWLAEETKPLLDPSLYTPNLSKLFLKLNLDTNNKTVHQTAMALVKAREVVAQKLNVPRNRVIDDSIIRVLAKRDLSEDKVWHDFIGDQSRESTNQLIAEYRSGAGELLEIPPLKKNRSIPHLALQALMLLMAMSAESYGISSSLIASKSDLVALYHDKDQADTDLLKGWRYEVYGQRALGFIKGEMHIGFEGQELKLIPL